MPKRGRRAPNGFVRLNDRRGTWTKPHREADMRTKLHREAELRLLLFSMDEENSETFVHRARMPAEYGLLDATTDVATCGQDLLKG